MSAGITTTFVEAITPHIKPEDVHVIVDIGTRDLGQSIELHETYPNAHIYAFEANPESAKECQAKAPDYITVIPKAVMDYDGEISFYSVDHSMNHGASSIFEPTEYVVGVEPLYGLEKVTVPCVRFDTWAKEQGIEQVDLAWVDVQSAEIPVLTGMGEYLKGIKAIATEACTGQIYYPSKDYEPTTYTTLDAFMKERGFVQVAYNQPWPLECDVVYMNKKLQ